MTRRPEGLALSTQPCFRSLTRLTQKHHKNGRNPDVGWLVLPEEFVALGALAAGLVGL